jgi:hypothetical protein
VSDSKLGVALPRLAINNHCFEDDLEQKFDFIMNNIVCDLDRNSEENSFGFPLVQLLQ